MPSRLSKLRWYHWVLVVLLGLGIIGALAPSSSTPQDEKRASEVQDTASDSPSDESGTPETPSCIALSSTTLANIAEGAQDGVGMSPIRGFAVKSPDFSKVYFLAVEFSATGVENQVGVWARNGIEDGLILSADSFAKQFTVWPDASKTDAQISASDRSISNAKACLDEQ